MGANTRLDGASTDDNISNANVINATYKQVYEKQKSRTLSDNVYKLFCGNVTDECNLGTTSDSEQLYDMFPTRGNDIIANNSGAEMVNVLIVNNYGSLGAGLLLYHTVNGNNIANCRTEYKCYVF